jgi:hypothetical protein
VQLLLSDDRFDASVVVDSSLLKRLTENKHEDLIALLLQVNQIKSGSFDQLISG